MDKTQDEVQFKVATWPDGGQWWCVVYEGNGVTWSLIWEGWVLESSNTAIEAAACALRLASGENF